MTTKILAYTNTAMTREETIARVRAHRAADEIVCGVGYESKDGKIKACCVGCIFDVYEHSLGPKSIGYPVEVIRMADVIHEGLGRTGGDFKSWPEEFVSAPAKGANLSLSWPRWTVWMLRGLPAAPLARNPACRKAVDGVLALYERWVATGTRPTKQEFEAAAYAAHAEAHAAYAEAHAAAHAAHAAAHAAYAEAHAAAHAAHAAYAADAAADALSKFWISARVELVRILKEAPVEI